MQTREPQKRVNWIFVIILIITVPLIIFAIFMMNTVPQKPRNTSTYDSTLTNGNMPDSLKSDTTSNKEHDSLVNGR